MLSKPFLRTLYIHNRQKLFDRLPEQSLAVINSNDRMPRNGDQFYPYRQHSDMMYLSGIRQEQTSLLLFKNAAGDRQEYLFILRPQPEQECWEGRKLRKYQATDISGIVTVYYDDEKQRLFNELILQADVIYLNSNENKRFKSDVPYMDIRFAGMIAEKYPGIATAKLAPLLEQLRLYKEEQELVLMKKACDITANTFSAILPVVKPGMYEYEIEAAITYEFLRQGADGHAYEPIVASGANACVLHYITNSAICRDGELLLLDFGAEYNCYAADCSRTIPVNGRFTQRQKQMYNAVLRVFTYAKSLVRPGITINQIQAEVCRKWEEEHIGLGLYSLHDVKKQETERPMYAKYFMHGVSHFLGLDVHDVGDKDIPLEPGMVITCEPGIYVPEESIGIRIENNLVVTTEGCRDLMQHIPLDPDEIENLMNR